MLVTKLKIAAVVCLTAVVGGGAVGGLLYPTHAAEGTKAVLGAPGVALAAADPPTAKQKSPKEAEIRRQLRAVKFLEADLEKQLRDLKDQEQAEAVLQQLRDRLRTLEKVTEQQRVQKALVDELNRQIRALEEKQFREEVLKRARQVLAKQEAISAAVREIEKALKKLREMTGDRKTEIEALGEIQKAVEAMKRVAQDLKEAQALEEDLPKLEGRKKQP
jgi:hypothetical protein